MEEFADDYELWPRIFPLTSHQAKGSYGGMMTAMGLKVAHYFKKYETAYVEFLALPALAWSVAYGLRPKVVHIQRL